jgi:hypothetical protein
MSDESIAPTFSIDSMGSIMVILAIFILFIIVLSGGQPKDWMYLVQDMYTAFTVYMQSMLRTTVR